MARGSHLTAGELGAEYGQHPTPHLTCIMKTKTFSRRAFIQQGFALAAGAPLAFACAHNGLLAAEIAGGPAQAVPRARHPNAKVAIVPCRTYGPEVRPALEKCFDLIGGIGALVKKKTAVGKLNQTRRTKSKTVVVRLTLTGLVFRPVVGRTVGETYMTHYTPALAVGSLLFAAGARR